MLSWNKCAGADGYYVYRKTASGSWLRIATVTGNANVTYLDTAAKSGLADILNLMILIIDILF